MPGTLGGRKNKAGSGHGARNHSHASGNRLVCWYYGPYQEVLRRKKRTIVKAAPNRMSRKQQESAWKKHQRNRSKQ
jgi:hypothetical protein